MVALVVNFETRIAPGFIFLNHKYINESIAFNIRRNKFHFIGYGYS